MLLRRSSIDRLSGRLILSTGIAIYVAAATASGFADAGNHRPDAPAPNDQPAYVPGEVIVKFDRVPNAQSLAAVENIFPMIQNWRELKHAAHYRNQPGVPHPLASYRVAVANPNIDAAALAGKMAQLPGILSAETNGYTHIAFVPNDPMYNQQWGPQKIRSEEAWDITLGDSNIIIAVADTGINFDHEDLAPAIWANDDSVNGRDDDGNGFIDDWRGWDFIANDNDPTDGHGHGSHTAGTAAARTDNGKGIAGMAQVTIMPLQVFNSSGSGTWEAIAEAVVYATDNGASVLNYSGGGFGGAQVLADAVQYSWANGMSVVAAAGNAATSTKFFPAAYPEVIAVAATDQNDRQASFSNFGDWLDVAAPGVDILSCFKGGVSSYTNMSGTSMASPHCAGLVALLYSVNPNLSPQDVRDLLQQNALDLGDPGFDIIYGWGRIDAASTVAAVGGPTDCLTLSLDQLVAGQSSTWTVTGGAEGEKIAIVYGFNNTPQTVNNQFGFCATFGFDGVNQNRLVAPMKATVGGQAQFTKLIPNNLAGLSVRFQSAQQNTCPDECVSNIIDAVVQ